MNKDRSIMIEHSTWPARALGGIFFLTASFAAPSGGAQDVVRFEPFFFNQSDPSTIYLMGDIDVRTPLNFRRVLNASGMARTLVLVSDGGLVHSALSVATDVRREGLVTHVPAESGCYSACSFLWFAGLQRTADGEVGVHQISSDHGDLASGQITISDIVDVLSEFGVPSEVIVRMLQTPSEEMHVLTEDDLVRHGLLDVPTPTLDASSLT